MSEIEIYTNENCPYCKQIKEHIEKENIEFINKDTSEFTEQWQNVVSLTGIPTVPTVKYKDEYFVPSRDFTNPQQLVNILKSFEKCKYSESKQILEKLKTLNYSMNMAFSKLDQLLRQIENKIK